MVRLPPLPMCICRPKPSSHIAFNAFTPIIVSATFVMAAEPSEATRVEGKVSEMESDDDTDGETLMICSLMDGGRKLGVYGGGTLYEKASKYEEEVMEREAEAYWEPVNAGTYPTKSSIEGKRTRVKKLTEDFICEGTMYKHTKMTWAEAPVEFQHPHEVQASESNPVNVLVHQHLIEDLLPFERDVYWATVWQKCGMCRQSDDAFKRWVATSRRVKRKGTNKKRSGADI